MKQQYCVIRIQTFHCIHKTVDIYKDIAEDFQTVFDTSNYELDRPFPTRKKSNFIKER